MNRTGKSDSHVPGKQALILYLLLPMMLMKKIAAMSLMRWDLTEETSDDATTVTAALVYTYTLASVGNGEEILFNQCRTDGGAEVLGPSSERNGSSIPFFLIRPPKLPIETQPAEAKSLHILSNNTNEVINEN